MSASDFTASEPPLVVEEITRGAVRFAGFWRRFAAGLIDYGIFVVLVQLLRVTHANVAGRVFLGLAIYGLYWLYCALMETSRYQGTLGKLAVGLAVTDDNYQRISFGKATGRYFAKAISFVILGFGFFMIGWTERKRGLHDMVAGTFVVERPTSFSTRYVAEVRASSEVEAWGVAGMCLAAYLLFLSLLGSWSSFQPDVNTSIYRASTGGGHRVVLAVLLVLAVVLALTKVKRTALYGCAIGVAVLMMFDQGSYRPDSYFYRATDFFYLAWAGSIAFLVSSITAEVAVLRSSSIGRKSAAPSPPPPVSPPGAEEFERLAALRERGHLTEEEFTQAKARLLQPTAADAPASTPPADERPSEPPHDRRPFPPPPPGWSKEKEPGHE